MMNPLCNHPDEFRNQSPTDAEINKFRLYQCKECEKWFSFLGDSFDWVDPNSLSFGCEKTGE